MGDEHLHRVQSSLTELGIVDPPDQAALEQAMHAVLTDSAPGEPARVRLTAAAQGLIIAERTVIDPVAAEPQALRGAVFPGEWAPGRSTAEHKSVSYLPYRDCARRAAEAGADIAVLTDSHGRLGEADRGNLIALVDGAAVTPPVRGLLAGIARGWALRWDGLTEASVSAAERERCDEIVMCNAVEGFAAVTEIDGHAVGDGQVGELARGLQSRFAQLFSA